jgi:hypothetical protein
MSLDKLKYVILLLVWCLFMGVTAISIGVGAAFPPLNKIAQPFVCPNGQMRVDSQTYRPSPGTTITTLDWQCVDRRTGEAQRINEMSMFLINGLIYGTILFAVIMLGYWMTMKRRAQRVAARSADVSNSYTSVDLPPGAYVTSADKYELRELTRQYQEGQFSEKEYQRKRKAILDRVVGRGATTSSAPYTQSASSEDAELQELKRMFDEGQLTNVEYWQKLSKITDHSVGQAKATLAGTSSTRANETYDMENKLAELKKLRDQGLITETDYEQKKTEILSRL